jgi:DNA invertase Pin-like site-specific DNA recombinase
MLWAFPPRLAAGPNRATHIAEEVRMIDNASLPNEPDVQQPEAKPAAQYIRMSTEHQQYSTENQADVIAEYAAKRGHRIVQTFADEGKSGLRIEGRQALRDLISVVQSGQVAFQTILVYDVSRWGRFQDADESAYYEYICRRAGINVEYCAEQFENDGSPSSNIIKTVKRAMAGEYSRELSTKVFKGQCKLMQLGYRQGGPAGYGLRRMLVDQQGEPKGLLSRGEQKSLQTDRVILVPGPQHEQQIVQQIYQLFTQEGWTERQIAEQLNRDGIDSAYDRPWTRGVVHQVLTNEKYIGNNVYNRISFKLKKKRVKNPPDMWVRADGVFDPIVDPQQFYTAQGIILERQRRYSDEELLAKLKDLAEKHSRLSGFLIDETDWMPPSSSYRSRFGSLVRAYRLIGYTPERDYRYIEINRRLREMHPGVVEDTLQRLQSIGATVERDETNDLFLVNGEYTASIVLSRSQQTQAGSLRWRIRLDRSLTPDITVVVRMDATNEQTLDYYLLPRIDVVSPSVRLAEDNGLWLDAYRFETLDYFFLMAARARIEVAA